MHDESTGLKEECGVFAVWGHDNASQLAYYGLHSLQHRGQEGAGIVTSNGDRLYHHKGKGSLMMFFHLRSLRLLKAIARLPMCVMRHKVRMIMRMSSHYFFAHKRVAWLWRITVIWLTPIRSNTN